MGRKWRGGSRFRNSEYTSNGWTDANVDPIYDEDLRLGAHSVEARRPHPHRPPHNGNHRARSIFNPLYQQSESGYNDSCDYVARNLSYRDHQFLLRSQRFKQYLSGLIDQNLSRRIDPHLRQSIDQLKRQIQLWDPDGETTQEGDEMDWQYDMVWGYFHPPPIPYSTVGTQGTEAGQGAASRNSCLEDCVMLDDLSIC